MQPENASPNSKSGTLDVEVFPDVVANVVRRGRPIDRNDNGAIPSGSRQEAVSMPFKCGPMDLPCARCGGVMEFLGSTTANRVCKATFSCDECGESIVSDISQSVHAALTE
jgi:hypothetical protein